MLFGLPAELAKLIHLVELGPLLQLFFDDYNFVICGLISEFYIKRGLVILICLS